jgi:hypothetical protein
LDVLTPAKRVKGSKEYAALAALATARVRSAEESIMGYRVVTETQR